MKPDKFSVRKRLQSFQFAFNGLKVMLKEEHNSRIHLFLALIATFLGWKLNISSIEWVLLVLIIGGVFAAELFNSALENLADHLSPERSEGIKKVKDLSAAAVLVCAMVSVAVACLIFLPKIFLLIR